MSKFIVPIILIGISITCFFTFTNPTYNEISSLKNTQASYNEALGNSKALENERDKLTTKYNSFDPESLARLQKFLPDSVDNIRLILEIEKIASPYGMVLKDVKYDSDTANTSKGAVSAPAGPPTPSLGIAQPFSRTDYGTWNLEFSTSGTYDNFLSFMRDLERNLRIVDISSVEFSSGSSSSSTGSKPESYKYDIKIKTYWLKN